MLSHSEGSQHGTEHWAWAPFLGDGLSAIEVFHWNFTNSELVSWSSNNHDWGIVFRLALTKVKSGKINASSRPSALMRGNFLSESFCAQPQRQNRRRCLVHSSWTALSLGCLSLFCTFVCVCVMSF